MDQSQLEIDIFPRFLTYWEGVKNLSLDEQIERWANEYLGPYPELLAKQTEDYAQQGLDWRQVAREKVFPFLGKHLEAMRRGHELLLTQWPAVLLRAEETLGYSDPTLAVFYVGIGCGAGWVTPYQGLPAVLFGLEAVAECGWTSVEAISGMIAHELGHVIHFAWRGGQGELPAGDPWWQLYEEGFASRCEGLILGRDSFHQACDPDPDWLAYCRSRRPWLAQRFLDVVSSHGDERPFFGSWFRIEGHSETGYFLGHEVIRYLEGRSSLRQIALLEDYEPACVEALRSFAADEA